MCIHSSRVTPNINSKANFFDFWILEGWDGEEDRVFTEEDWTNTNSKKVLPYARSKCEAEKAAWNFIKQLTNGERIFEILPLHF